MQFLNECISAETDRSVYRKEIYNQFVCCFVLPQSWAIMKWLSVLSTIFFTFYTKLPLCHQAGIIKVHNILQTLLWGPLILHKPHHACYVHAFCMQCCEGASWTPSCCVLCLVCLTYVLWSLVWTPIAGIKKKENWLLRGAEESSEPHFWSTWGMYEQRACLGTMW